jgi:hypothetical protein
LHKAYLEEMQRFRGAVYLLDGAISRQCLTSDGKHKLEIDDRSWHVITLDDSGQVMGCARYLPHPNTVRVEQLSLWPPALNTQWGASAATAIEAEICEARKRRVSYVEVGGWALARKSRCTAAALRIALATYSLAQMLGGCFGIATATVRNNSSSILRRIGGSVLALGGVDIPAYFEPQYGCLMELLRFDSRSPRQQYRDCVTELKQILRSVPVICAGPVASRSLNALAVSVQSPGLLGNRLAVRLSRLQRPWNADPRSA